MVAEEKHIDIQFYMKDINLDNPKLNGVTPQEADKKFMGNKKLQVEAFCKEVGIA